MLVRTDLKRAVMLTLACLSYVPAVASAQSVYEPFSYPTTSAGQWGGGAGFQEGSEWVRFNEDFDITSTMLPGNIVPGLSYLNGRPVVAQGNAYSPAGFQGITRPTASAISGDPAQGGNGQTVWMSYLFKANNGATDGNLVSLTRGGPALVDSAPRLLLSAPRNATFDKNFARAQIWDQFGDRGFESAEFPAPNTGVNLLVLKYVPDNSPSGVNTGTLRAWLNPFLNDTELDNASSFGSVLDTTEGLAAFNTLRVFSFSGDADQRPTFDELRVANTFADAVRQARLGDANADGNVNFTDLVVVAQNYTTTGRSWYEGDFNYDGNVNFEDLVSLARNYNTSSNGTLGESNFNADWALAQSIVPEPASLATVALGSLAILTRRRTRR